MGWAYDLPFGLEYHDGDVIPLYGSLQPQAYTWLPAQEIVPKHEAGIMAFFIAEVIFADGSKWTVDRSAIDSAISRYQVKQAQNQAAGER